MTTGRAEICSHRETRVRAMSTSLTSTRSSRTAQSAGSSLSKPWVGAPLPPDVTVPVWCRGESENRRPVNAEKAAPMVYHPRASRPARAFGEPEPPDPSSRARARSARVAAPVAAGFKAGAAQRPSTVDPARSRVSSATRPATAAAAAGDGSPGPQLFITSVGRATPRTTSARHGVSVAAADASRRHLAATRTCATSASTAAAARNHPHATLFDALRDHTALRAEWRAELDAGLALAGRERERAERAEEATNELRSTLALKKDEIDRAAAARDAAAAAGARAECAEGKSASLRARVAELETALRAKDAGHEAHETALRNAEGRVREARAAATAAAASTARDRDAVEAARAETRSAKAALAASERRVSAGAAEARLARTTLEEMAVERKAHARALTLLRAARDGAEAARAEAEAEKVEVVKELAYARAAAGAAAEKSAASLTAAREETAAVSSVLERSRRTNDAMREDALIGRGELEGLTRDLAEARAETEKWRFEAQSLARALTILRGQHDAYVIAAGGAPAPATPLLRRRASGEDDEDDELPAGCVNDGDGGESEGGEAQGRATQRSAGVGPEGDVVAPRRASEAALSAEVGDDSELSLIHI